MVGLIFLSMASLTRPVWGQSSWPNYPSNSSITVTSGGNVGIGTANPVDLLTVGDGTAATGISVNGANSGSNGAYIWGLASGAREWLVSSLRGWTGGGTLGLGVGTIGAVPFAVFTSLTERMRIDSNGNVGIGTSSPQYLLSVNGQIGVKDVIVTSSGWSDYVFHPGYRLRPLSEVNAYIKANHHLPEIPSEAEVKEKGVSVADMQAKLLAKIEELTLHMIQQQEENRQLRERVGRLEHGFSK